MDGEEITIEGKKLKCLHCGNTFFTKLATKVNQALFAFIDVEFLSKGSNSYICTKCGFKHEFVNPK